jgi:flagellar protein FlaG
MIEVRNTVQIGGASLAPSPAPASTKGSAEVQEEASGKVLPPSIENKPADEVSKEPKEAQSAEKLESAVASINDYVQSIQRDLQFTVDKDLNKTVIKVVDGDSGELIRQIPEEVFLDLARKLKEDGELRLVNALG